MRDESLWKLRSIFCILSSIPGKFWFWHCPYWLLYRQAFYFPCSQRRFWYVCMLQYFLWRINYIMKKLILGAGLQRMFWVEVWRVIWVGWLGQAGLIRWGHQMALTDRQQTWAWVLLEGGDEEKEGLRVILGGSALFSVRCSIPILF